MDPEARITDRGGDGRRRRRRMNRREKFPIEVKAQVIDPFWVAAQKEWHSRLRQTETERERKKETERERKRDSDRERKRDRVGLLFCWLVSPCLTFGQRPQRG